MIVILILGILFLLLACAVCYVDGKDFWSVFAFSCCFVSGVFLAYAYGRISTEKMIADRLVEDGKARWEITEEGKPYTALLDSSLINIWEKVK